MYVLCFSSFKLFLSSDISLSYVINIWFTCVLYPQNVSIDSTSSSSKSFHIFSAMYFHLIPARPFVIFSHTALSAMNGWQPLFWHILSFVSPFQLTSLLIFGGCITSSAINTVLLVVLDPSVCLAAVICTVPSCFTNFAFLSQASPAYSSFGTITFKF